MSALLGEPFLLANYPSPSQNFPKSGEGSKTVGNRYVTATCSNGDPGEAFATVSVQGDGIHVLELSNMHASVSHTLGPSAFFAAPAVTRFDNPDASTTYVVMQSATDGIELAGRGRTVWRWRDHHSRRPEEPPEPKQSAVFPQSVAKIWAPSYLSSHVIAISPSGGVMLSDDTLKLISSNATPESQSMLLKSWVFETERCSFLPRQRDQARGMVVICFTMVATQLKLRITLAQSTGELEEVTECDLGVQEKVTDISCDPSGYATVLTQLGEWKLFRLGCDPTGIVTATPLGEALHLTGLSLSPSTTSGNRITSGPSIISVGSSFVLLAGISCGSTPEIVLLLWDIQYSVVLASQTFMLPSTVAHSPKSPAILELVPASKSQALLVLSPAVATAAAKRTASAVPSRSTVLVVPLGIPVTSTIALAMGKAHSTQKWLQTTHIPARDEDQGRQQVMQSVQQAFEQGRPQAAEATFFSWVEKETARIERLQETDVPSDDNHSDDEAVTKTQRESARGKDRRQGSSRPPLSHQFVTNILNAALQSSERSDARYSPKLVLYLINRKAVGNAMVQGGLFPALRHYQEWDSIASALRNVHDLPETDVIQLLTDVVKSHRQHNDLHVDGMQVDAPSDIPSLPGFLATVVAYTTSPSMLRLALKLHLSDVKDIICTLEVLEGWLSWWCTKNPGLAVGLDDRPIDEVHVPDAGQSNKPSRKSGIPLLKDVMSFLQSMLDAHFLTLLQYPPSYNTLERISRHLQQQLTLVEDLDRLRGPLEAFVRVQTQKARARRTETDGSGDWRKRHKEAAQAAEFTVGLYQIEELVI